MKTPKCPVPGIRATVVYIDPGWAAKLLQTNPAHQRSISAANLRKIEASLRKDEFKLNGQPVIIDEEKRLLDGQHRLQASVNTSEGFWTVLVEGIPSEFFKFMDCGKSRTFSDVLRTMGNAQTSKLSASVSRLAEYLRDPQCLGTSIVFAHSELLDVTEMCPGLDASVRFLNTCAKLIPQSQLAWLHYLANQAQPQACSTFFFKLATGENLDRSDPVFHLRTRILNDREYGYHPTLREMLALIIKTWNAHLRGTPTKRLAWQGNEEFPILDLPKIK